MTNMLEVAEVVVAVVADVEEEAVLLVVAKSEACQLICIRGAYAVMVDKTKRPDVVRTELVVVTVTVTDWVTGTVTTLKSRLLWEEHDTVGNDPELMIL